MLKTFDWHFRDARELFESAREASRDAERIHTQLQHMEQRSQSLGGGGFEPRVRSTPDPQRMEARSVAHMDMEERLRERQEQDYALIDLACCVLYGRDSETGLSVLVPAWWCDALWWHYLDDATWERTADAVHYSAQRCKQVRSIAFDIIDSWGIVATMQGRPLNTMETWEHDERRKSLLDVAQE